VVTAFGPIGATLAGLSFPPFSFSTSSVGATYESLVLGRVVQAVSALTGAGVVARSRMSPNTAPTTFLLRGRPGRLLESIDYGYVIVSYKLVELEVHCNTYHVGSSGASHEVDISLLDSSEAVRCRKPSNDTDPSARYTRAIIECKFRGSSSGLRTNMARAFAGLTLDMGGLAFARLVSNRNSASIQRYCTLRNTKIRFHGEVVTGNASSDAQFLNAIVDDIMKWWG
jgi:hypothetical protein